MINTFVVLDDLAGAVVGKTALELKGALPSVCSNEIFMDVPHQ